jgi:hypothetical protein
VGKNVKVCIVVVKQEFIFKKKKGVDRCDDHDARNENIE